MLYNGYWGPLYTVFAGIKPLTQVQRVRKIIIVSDYSTFRWTFVLNLTFLFGPTFLI